MSDQETPDDSLPPEIPVADYDESIIEGRTEEIDFVFPPRPGPPIELPNSIHAEEAILNAIMRNNGVLDECVATGLKAEDFFLEVNQSVFRQMQKLREESKGINIVSLACDLALFGKPPAGENHWREKLKLITASSTVEHEQVTDLVKIVREKSIARQLLHLLNGTMGESLAEDQPISRLLGQHAEKIWGLVDQCAVKGPVKLKDVLRENIQSLEKRYENKGSITGIETGFDRFDELTAGLQPNDLILIAARPGVGKTAWCLNVAVHAALKRQERVMIFSLEMSESQLVSRMVSSLARVDSHKIRTGHLNKEDWGQIARALGELSEADIYIDDSAKISVAEMWAKVRRIGGVRLVFVDYIQLVDPDGQGDNRDAALGSVSRGLKAMAKGLHIPVVAACQQRRKPADRLKGDNRPRLEDLRESGSLEADADLVAFLWREELFNPTDDNTGVAEMIIAKQRNGPTDEFKMAWIAPCTSFENLWVE